MRLLQDNAHVHTAAITKTVIRKRGFSELNHPPYSADFTPSDYLLFSKLKPALRQQRYTRDEEAQWAIMFSLL